MKDYYQLTTIGKARRLRQLAIQALQSYDLDVASVRLITADQNGIFRVDTQDTQKYVMRVVLPDAGHSLDEIKSEMMFLNALADTDIPAPIPIRSRDGRWIVTATADGVPQPRQCVLFSWVSGVELEERQSPETWALFGELSARLHQFGQGFRPPDGFTIPRCDSPFPYDDANVLFDDAHRHIYDDEAYALITVAYDRVQSEIDSLYADPSDLIVTHGDLHQWNVLISRKQLSPIDFEDLIWAYPIQDIGTTLYYNRFDDNYEALLAGFKHGYERVLPFPEAYDGQLELYLLARRLGLINYILSARELDIADYPNFIPLTVERITDVRDTYWQ